MGPEAYSYVSMRLISMYVCIYIYIYIYMGPIFVLCAYLALQGKGLGFRVRVQSLRFRVGGYPKP